jgi:hypothetical protein
MSPIGYFIPDGKTVGLRGELLDQGGKPLGRFEVVLNYDYLMQDILTEGWMVAQMACLVNQEGHYLAHSSSAMQARHCLGETQDPMELAMLKAMKEKDYGTLMGEGYNPDMVIGFYKLHAAPWAIMLHAGANPGSHFAISFLLPGGRRPLLTVILVLSAWDAAGGHRHPGSPPGRLVAQDYGEPLPVASRDESAS